MRTCSIDFIGIPGGVANGPARKFEVSPQDDDAVYDVCDERCALRHRPNPAARQKITNKLGN